MAQAKAEATGDKRYKDVRDFKRKKTRIFILQESR